MNSLYRLTPTWLIQLSQLSRNKNVPPALCSAIVKSTAGNPSTSLSTSYSTKSVKPDTKREAMGEEPVGVDIDINLINHLERTSLVDFGNEEALSRLQEAIRFADTLFEVDTSGVEPLTSVLENESLYLREDKVHPTSREDILKNAVLTEEDYFVAPPGNIPLEPQSQSKVLVK